MWRDFTKALREVWRASGEGSGPYRPEQHYMRGPGPKWRAKYGCPVSQTSPAAAKAAPRDLTERHA